MNVTQMLKLKGSTTVETVSPRMTVREAASLLDKKRFGALVVSLGDGTVSGILSERDIVRGLGREGAAVLGRSVSALMTAEVQCCQPNESADAVLEKMSAGRFRHMPVMEDGRMIGLLSIGDVVKARIFEMQEENAAMQTMLHG